MRAMSPELVLVDKALRPAALAALPECPDVFTALKQRRSGDPIRQLRAGLTISEPISSSATDGRASWLSRGLVVAAVCASSVTAIGLAFTTGASAPRSEAGYRQKLRKMALEMQIPSSHRMHMDMDANTRMTHPTGRGATTGSRIHDTASRKPVATASGARRAGLMRRRPARRRR